MDPNAHHDVPYIAATLMLNTKLHYSIGGTGKLWSGNSGRDRIFSDEYIGIAQIEFDSKKVL